MKLNKFIALLFPFIAISCNNTLSYPEKNDVINLVQPSEVYVYSGNSLMTRAYNYPSSTGKVQDNPSAYQNAPSTTNRGESVSTEEYNEVMSYLAAHPNEGQDTVSITSYYLQNVGSSGKSYTTTPDQNGVIHQTGMQMDYFVINGWHVNDYNAQGGPRTYVEDWPLSGLSYHDSFGNNTFNYYKFYYIPLSDGTVGLYLCFDYATISQQGNVEPDGTYDDWVIRIWPADGREFTIPTEGNTGDTGDTGNTGSTDNTDSIYKDNVEINLSLETHNTDYDPYMTTHLSIHVRANTDVEVYIPIPFEYLCEVDDFAIVAKHDFDETRIPTNEVRQFTIDGNVVTLKIDRAKDGFTVTTSGINQSIIDYLDTTYGDGLTFEVWNYTNVQHSSWITDKEHATIDKTSLGRYLNSSTVTFSNIPSLYVNAFNATENGTQFEDDYVVSPTQFGEYKVGPFLNGSVWNHLYYNN